MSTSLIVVSAGKKNSRNSPVPAIGFYADCHPVTGELSMAYKEILRNSIRTYEDLEKWLTGQKARVDPRLKEVIAKYPMRVNTYYLGLIEKMNDGIWRQAIPDVDELEHYMDLSARPSG